jgi:hypothetical protein
MRRKFFFIGCLLSAACCLSSTATFTWGFFAHKKINQLAVFTLPPGMITFYKKNIDYLTEHAVDPDRRRYSVADEAARHYIDIDHYGKNPFDSVPKYWKDAVKKYSEDTLKEYGILPWHIEKMMYRLTQAFKDGNADRIIYLSANLGHYIADAHVPLHNTENYNGQLTNQIGIHAFWESRIPELFFDKWNFLVGRAKYIDNINDEVWKIVKESYYAADSVLKFEAELNKQFSPAQKYSYEQRGNATIKTYSAEYCDAYEKMLNGMVQRRMKQAVLAVGSFWCTAWMNAGQPDISRLLEKSFADSLKTVEKETEKMWKTGKPLKGHEE